MAVSDQALLELAAAIVAGDGQGVARLLAASQGLAKESFRSGASRQAEGSYFLDAIKRQIYAGDTGLHVAAAAYQTEIVRGLLRAGADVGAKNRRGQEALHYAAIGSPGSRTWNPAAQAATIACLIEAGADPNTVDMDGVTPLHRAVRTRCAEAVRTLLAHGADPARKNKSGSTPMVLARLTTGRGGTGTQAAKEQQREIVRILEERSAATLG
jgi:ankyrin repeat protein